MWRVLLIQIYMKTIIGIFTTRDSAELAINELQSMCVPDGGISYLALDKETKVVTSEYVSGADNTSSGAATGAVTGGVVGAVAGLVVANGILPGLGTLFVAGPIAVALGLTGVAATTAAATMTGAAAGGIIGGLANFGVDEKEAHIYEERIKGGDIAVSAPIDNLDEAVAVSMFSSHGAGEVHVYTRS